MASIKQSVDEVRNLSRMFKAVVNMADTLDGIGGIEQLEKAAQAPAMQVFENAVDSRYGMTAAEFEQAMADNRADRLLAKLDAQAPAKRKPGRPPKPPQPQEAA